MREAGPVDANAVFRAIETEGILGEIVSIVARAAVRAVTSEPKPSRPISSTRRASSHRPSAVVLPFEILPFTLPVAEPALPQVRSNDRALPLHVVPLAEESLFSRLESLVSRLQVSFHTLASHSFGIDDRTGRTVWWHRPHPWTLAKISQCTGVKTTRLRSMTFEELQPVYRGDEDPARFLPPGGTTPGRPTGEPIRFAICGPCLEGDSVPYLRSLWHLGWLAVCPIYGTVLLTRSERCHCGIRVPQLSVCAPFSPITCTRCGESLLGQCYRTAPEVTLQDALLRGKRENISEIAGIGTFTWQKLVALADIILDGFWRATILEERESILLRYQFETIEAPDRETRLYDCRHDSLLFLAWLIDGWPRSLWGEHRSGPALAWLEPSPRTAYLIAYCPAGRGIRRMSRVRTTSPPDIHRPTAQTLGGLRAPCQSTN